MEYKVSTIGPYDYHRLVFGPSELFVRLGRRIGGQRGNLARDWQTPGVRVPGAHRKRCKSWKLKQCSHPPVSSRMLLANAVS